MKILKSIQKWCNKRNLGVKGNRKKVGILFFVISIVIFAVLMIRLLWIVGVGEIQGTNLQAQTDALYQGQQITKARRGTIYDRYGQPIAEDATSYSIYAILSKTYVGTEGEKLYAQEKNFERISEVLHDQLKIKKDDVLKRLRVNENLRDGEVGAYQVEFGNAGKGISLSKRNAIDKIFAKDKIKGIYFSEHPDRIYPNGNFASMFIGKAEPQDDEESSTKGLVGTMGLEKAYNQELSGQDGVIVYKKDLQGNPMPGTVESEEPSVDGQDIYTTLDTRLQTYLETLIDKVQNEYKPEELTATLMDAKTGEILALSQRPTFNPDSKKAPEIWRNLLVQDMYEPGSTMKLFTTASSINTGQYNPNATYMAGEIKVYDATIHDHDWEKNGQHPLNFKQALWWSSNVGMVHLEEKLGLLWPAYQRKFLFGKSTDSGLPSEVAGTIPSDNPVDLAMSSFGQGINVTNFQMMRAFSSISNNGLMLQPHYISKIVDTNSHTQKIAEPEVLGQPITEDTAKEVRDLMVGVTEDSQWGSAYYPGKGPIYKVSGVTLSPKTGTAQIGNPTGGYYQNKYINSVVIMAPTKNPKFVLYVTMKLDGAMPATAISEITNPLLKRALEAEEQPISVGDGAITEIKVPNYEGKNVDEASVLARRQMINPVVIGDGETVKKQSTPIGEKLSPNDKIMFVSDGKMTMPDVTTWKKEELDKFETLTGVKLTLKGEGVASSQSVAFGTVIKAGQKIKVTLS